MYRTLCLGLGTLPPCTLKASTRSKPGRQTESRVRSDPGRGRSSRQAQAPLAGPEGGPGRGYRLALGAAGFRGLWAFG